jgi:Tfp pilus assembly protein PilF
VLLMLPLLAMADPNSLQRAKTEAEIAIGLDRESGPAHSALGGVRLLADWDFAGAEASLRRALTLEPDSVEALLHYAQLMNASARFDEAQSALERAVKRDPVSPLLGVQLGIVLYNQKRFDHAAQHFRDVLHRESGYGLAHYYLALCYGFLGRFDEAFSHLAKSGLHPGVLRTDAAWLLLRKGDSSAAERIYAELSHEVAQGKMSASAPVLLAASTGKVDEALGFIDASFAQRAPELLGLQSDPRLEPLRTHAKYHLAVKRLMAGGE